MDALFILGSTFNFLVRVLVAQPYDIPSAAMAPTLETGDYVWAVKFAYGYSNLSLPLGENLPAFTYAKTEPRRGDVVVFRPAGFPSVNYVMRVVGLAGDTVAMRGGIVYINGAAVPLTAAGAYSGALEDYAGGRLYWETLPGGRRHKVLDTVDAGFADDTEAKTVPAGHYFVLGDNRDNSNDSRFSTGVVPGANIIAKVVLSVTWPAGRYTAHAIE